MGGGGNIPPLAVICLKDILKIFLLFRTLTSLNDFCFEKLFLKLLINQFFLIHDKTMLIPKNYSTQPAQTEIHENQERLKVMF